MLKQKIECEYVALNEVDWQPLPEGFIAGGRWKLLLV